MKKRLLVVLVAMMALICFTVLACDDDDDDSSVDDDVVDDDIADDDVADDDLIDDDAVDDDIVDDDTGDYVVPPAEHEAPPWPEWILRHWVWEDESTAASAQDLVDGYLANDIPVGAIIIDSPWETGYNTFIFDPNDYPNPQEMIDYLHDLDVRVLLWITPNVNVDSPNYQEGFDNGYYINDGRTVEWWKGEGSFIDYNNPDAMEWWHGQMENVLDMGIDGWKCDGTAFYTLLFIMVQTYTGPISPKEYQEQYYRDFFYYTREVLGPDRVTLARPVDSYGVPFWGPSFAPHDANVAGWVGDQDPTWTGMNAALINMWFSGERGYVNFGSDIAGYRSDDIRDKNVFIRWAQLGALSPIMENGGAGEHRPWMYDQETLDIYRKFTKLHHALIPYMYSQGAEYLDAGISVFRPIEKWTWHYQLGDEMLVAAITGPGEEKTMKFPAGDDWIYYWDGTEYAGGTQELVEVPLDEFPVFIRKGAIVPMVLEDSVFALENLEIDPITAHIWPGESSSFEVYEEGGSGATIAYDTAAGMRISLSATYRLYAFRIMDADQPTSVEVNPEGTLAEAGSLAELREALTGWYYDAQNRELWVKPGDASQGLIVDIN